MSQFIKNVASQRVQFVMIDTSGDAVTSGITVQISLDGAALGASGGVATHLGSGLWDYAFTQAETNADHVGLLASKAGAVPVCLNLLTADIDISEDWADGGRLDLLLDVAASATGTVDQTPVPRGRTAKLVRKVDRGLVGEYALELSEGETQLIAVDFAEDMPTNGLVISATATETSAPEGGAVTLGTPGVDKSLVKFTANPDTAGTYTVEVIATYSGSSGSAQGTITLSVV